MRSVRSAMRYSITTSSRCDPTPAPSCRRTRNGFAGGHRPASRLKDTPTPGARANTTWHLASGARMPPASTSSVLGSIQTASWSSARVRNRPRALKSTRPAGSRTGEPTSSSRRNDSLAPSRRKLAGLVAGKAGGCRSDDGPPSPLQQRGSSTHSTMDPHSLLTLLETWGYAALLVLLIATGIGSPIPEDLLLLTAGYLIFAGVFLWPF